VGRLIATVRDVSVDRIRKALDLARQERERSVELGEPRSHDSKPDARLPASIVYKTTKSFSASAELLESNRILGVQSPGAAAGAFRMLRTQVLQRMMENGWRSLAIFSPCRNDGKTTTAINLAISLANDHLHTVLLVDFDLKRPSVGAKLGLSPQKGADDLLRGQAEVEECLYHPDGFDRLVVLPARSAMHESSEALAGRRGRELVAELRSRYPDRLVLFDLPPILEADDALAFAPLVECGLVVVAEGLTSRKDLLRSMELLHKTPLLGTVLNRAADAASAYG
jgi:Mrp family chromosome partitioning ATPase